MRYDVVDCCADSIRFSDQKDVAVGSLFFILSIVQWLDYS